MEKTNIRYVVRDQIEDDIDFASIDVSFISLTKVIGPLQGLLKQGGEIVALIKPQFEAGREKVGKKGVVRDPKVHQEVIEAVLAYARGIGYGVHGVDYSPIKGPEGNIEYLAYLKNNVEGIELSEQAHLIVKVVALSHETGLSSGSVLPHGQVEE